MEIAILDTSMVTIAEIDELAKEGYAGIVKKNAILAVKK